MIFNHNLLITVVMIISGRAVSITTTKHQPPTANAARVHALHLHLHFTADKEGWYVFELSKTTSQLKLVMQNYYTSRFTNCHTD